MEATGGEPPQTARQVRWDDCTLVMAERQSERDQFGTVQCFSTIYVPHSYSVIEPLAPLVLFADLPEMFVTFMTRSTFAPLGNTILAELIWRNIRFNYLHSIPECLAYPEVSLSHTASRQHCQPRFSLPDHSPLRADAAYVAISLTPDVGPCSPPPHPSGQRRCSGGVSRVCRCSLTPRRPSPVS